jgi:hypothetical protein
MTARTYSRGWEITAPMLYDEKANIYRSGQWRYTDTGEPYSPDDKRPCRRCGQEPTPEGHDACLGKLDGVVSACCGHGVHEGGIIREGEDVG